MALELKDIKEDEDYKLINEWNVALGIIFNKRNNNIIAFSYKLKGVDHYYKVIEKWKNRKKKNKEEILPCGWVFFVNYSRE